MNAADWSFHSTTVWHSVNGSHCYILTSSESHVPTIHALCMWAIYSIMGSRGVIHDQFFPCTIYAVSKGSPPLYITPFLLEKRNYFPLAWSLKREPDLLNHSYHANKDHQNCNWIINHLIISSSRCFLTLLEIAQNLSLAQAKNTRLRIINSQRHESHSR